MDDLTKNVDKLANTVIENRILKAGVLLLGLAFTLSAVYNHYYNIKLNKIRIKKESEGLKT